MWDKIELRCILLSFLFAIEWRWVVSEFRFCYNGPQRMKELDCPGGFIAHTKLPLTCKYFARTANVSTAKAKFVEDVCQPDKAIEIDVLKVNEDPLDGLGSGLQQVVFEVDDQILDQGDLGGEYKPEDVCFNDCLSDWIDPSLVEDEQFIEDKVTDKFTLDTGAEVARLNNEVFLQILDEDEDEEDGLLSKKKKSSDPFRDEIDDWQDLRIIKLLAKSMRITAKECAPFVEEKFFRQVLKAMTYLSRKNQSLIQDVTLLEYKYFSSVLNRCLQRRNLHFVLNGTDCGDHSRVDGIYYFKKQQYWKYRKTGKSFQWGRHNPYIEAAWNAIEFVHGYCFESFIFDMMDLHTYQVALEGLFTTLVMRQWVVKFRLKNEIFWNSVLSTANINDTMRNLDACVIGGNSMAPWTKRLERPFISAEGSQSTTLDKNYPVTPLERGWKESPANYWEWYESKGGFKEISKNFGVCIDSGDVSRNEDEMNEEIDTYTNANCPAGITSAGDAAGDDVSV